MFFDEKAGAREPGTPASPKGTAPERKAPHTSDSVPTPSSQDTADIPPGLIGDLCGFIYDAAPHPNRDIALAGAIALLSGICGRAYNTYTNAGLNQYILLLASTGMGKEAAASGISKALNAVTKTVPAASDFKGPALVSSAGLLKWLDKKPSVVSIIGEFGYKLKAISSPRAKAVNELLSQADHASLATLIEAPLFVTKLSSELRDSIRETVYAKIDPEGLALRNQVLKAMGKVDVASLTLLPLIAKLRAGTEIGAWRERAKAAAIRNLGVA